MVAAEGVDPPGAGREPIRFLVFSASLRAGSLNGRLGSAGCRDDQARTPAVWISRRWSDFDAPSYDADVQAVDGLSDDRRGVSGSDLASDAFVISSPEYNFSMPGSAQELDRLGFSLQPAAVQRTARAADVRVTVDGRRQSGLWALRVPLEHLGARIYPDMFSLARAHHAFDENGRFVDSRLEERFGQNIVAFMDLVEASKHYPCVKTKWVEYLGEHPDPAIDRVE